MWEKCEPFVKYFLVYSIFFLPFVWPWICPFSEEGALCLWLWVLSSIGIGLAIMFPEEGEDSSEIKEFAKDYFWISFILLTFAYISHYIG
ncbi:MAG: hypothetical protein IKS45_04435 [Thermoguttaceae bacterium]|nr:hypothetical protein [Thermoguttaceae bacterium]MBR6435732.1 hypothetical protein [Thermoguttaceae bacterium]